MRRKTRYVRQGPGLATVTSARVRLLTYILLLFLRMPQHSGSLYVTTMQVAWLDDEDASVALAVDYPKIAMHAVSTSTASFPHASLYMQIGVLEGGHEDDDPTEVRFVLDDAQVAAGGLDAAFAAISECLCNSMVQQADGDMMDGDGEMFVAESDLSEFLAQDAGARARYDRLESVFRGVEVAQFAEADEQPDPGEQQAEG